MEENILKKANQKRMLGDMAIEGGNFTTTFFKEVCIFNGIQTNQCLIFISKLMMEICWYLRFPLLLGY